MILPVGLVALIANRMLLGLGEGPAYPLTLHSLYKWFPDQDRPLPTSLVILGSATGLWLIAPAIVFVIVHYSWRAAFSVLGLVSLAWCIVWLLAGKEGPLAPAASDLSLHGGVRAPYVRLLSSRTFIGTIAVAFAAYWLATLAVVWLPAYLTVGAGYTQAEAGWIVTLPTLGLIIVMPGGSALSQWLMRRGASSRLARGGLSCAGLLVAGLLLLALPWVSATSLVLLCVGLAVPCGNLIVSLGYVTVAEISPISQRGAMLAITNAVAALAGPLAPTVMGLVVDSSANAAAGFRIGFMIVGAIVASIAVLAMFLMHPESDRARYAPQGSAFGLKGDLSS
jgi:MFS family permease